jgi:molybdopterin converting factor small subunit
VESEGDTVADLLVDLEAQFPGIRFRVIDEQGRLRQHMKVFVDQDAVRDLSTPLAGVGEVTIMQALSGG